MMYRNMKWMNVILGGGGVKGIAYVGVFDVLKRNGLVPRNLAGVSAGAIAAVLAGAGCHAQDMWDTLEAFEFDQLHMDSIEKKVPAIRYLAEYAWKSRLPPDEVLMSFLNSYFYKNRYTYRHKVNGPQRKVITDRQTDIMKSILTFCREGCLFDGDLLEEWIAGALARRGIRTFADLRGGRPDEKNPSGYRVRMTGVDCNRLKIVTLPDDAVFYGIKPDDLEVARAVRISTAVPFAFKPVVLYRTEGDTKVQYNLVDGGVLNSYPTWLIGNSSTPTAGFRLHSTRNNPFIPYSPLGMLKGLIASVHDIGAPPENADTKTPTGEIDTGEVSFLDFGLSTEKKHQLLESGRKTALNVLDKIK